MRQFQGRYLDNDISIALVVSRFNETITKQLLSGAVECFTRHGVDEERLTVAWVPGAFEIPLVAKRLAQTGNYDAIVCLGAVIRGATTHFDFVAGGASSGISQLSLEFSLPVIFGVLTTDTLEQAFERSGTKAGNKGFEAALAALEMTDLLQQLSKSSSREVPTVEKSLQAVIDGTKV